MIRMRVYKPLTYLVLVVCFFCVCAANSFAASLQGVNQVNLAWVKSAEREQILRSIKEAGFNLVRLTLVPPFDESIRSIAQARDVGLSVLLNINISYPQFNSKNAEVRAGSPGFYAATKLSNFDPALFISVLKPILDQIDEGKIPIFAIEIGNEINWADYNGDLQVSVDSRGPSELALTSSERSIFAIGLKNYVLAIKMVKALILKSTYNSEAKIISAGLANVPIDDSSRRRAQYVSPIDTIKLLNELGIRSSIDAYGVHLYPPEVSSVDRHYEILSEMLSFCTAEIPCWLTEWGLPSTRRGCQIEDEKRVSAVRAFREALHHFEVNRLIGAAFYFDFFDDRFPFSLWRCGRLMPAGHEVAR